MHRRRGPTRSAALFRSPSAEPKAPMGTSDVLIFDTTLRDGEQAPGNSLTPEEKLRLARQLDALGVDIIEAGFPAASEGDYRSVREIAAEVRTPVIAALARCTDRDIELAGEALRGAERSGIHVFISTSDLHIREKLRTDPRGGASSGRGRPCAGRGGTPTTWSSPPRMPAAPIPTFSAGWWRPRSRRAPPPSTCPTPSATRCRHEYAAMFRDVLRPGAGRRPGDPERALPRRSGPGGGQLAGGDRGRGAPGRVHGQRHRRAGRQRRAGGDRHRLARCAAPPLGFRCNVESREIYRTSQLLSYLTGVFPQPNKAIVGRNAFAHEAGHPPARHAPERAHLRDHPARDGGHSALDARAGQALGPARRSSAATASWATS